MSELELKETVRPGHRRLRRDRRRRGARRPRGARVSLLGPSSVDTEIFVGTARRPAAHESRAYPELAPEDGADVLIFMVTRPARSSISELPFRLSGQV